MTEHNVLAEHGKGSDWRAVAHDPERQVDYVLRRCLAAAGNDGGQVAMEALILPAWRTQAASRAARTAYAALLKPHGHHQVDTRRPWQQNDDA